MRKGGREGGREGLYRWPASYLNGEREGGEACGVDEQARTEVEGGLE